MSDNNFIAEISTAQEPNKIIKSIPCNHIFQHENCTIIRGVIENSSAGYDVNIASIPSSVIVILKSIRE